MKKKSLSHKFLEKLQVAPLFPLPAPFSLEEFSLSLQKAFDIESLSIAVQSQNWIEGDKCLAESGHSPVVLSLELASQQHPFFVVVDEVNVISLVTMCMSHDMALSVDLESAKSLFRCIALETMVTLSSLASAPIYTARFASRELSSVEDHFSVTLSVSSDSQTVSLTLLFPENTYTSLQTVAAQLENHEYPIGKAEGKVNSKADSKEASISVAETMNLTVSVCAGSVTSSQQDIASLELGDVLLLDQCSYKPSTSSGTFALYANGVELFTTSYEDGALTVVDAASVTKPGQNIQQRKVTESHNKEEEIMKNSSNPSEKNTYNQNSDPLEQQEKPSNSLHDAEQYDDEFYLDDDELSDFDMYEKGASKPGERGIEDGNEEDTPPQSHTLHTEEQLASSHKLKKYSDIPLHIKAEITSFDMTLGEIAALQVGNTLKATCAPDTVVLTSNGVAIAKGTLVQVGDSVGIQIDELAK